MPVTNVTNSTDDASTSVTAQRDWLILVLVAVACLVLAVLGLVVNVTFLHKEDEDEERPPRFRKSSRAAATFLATAVCCGGSRFISVLDLFTDVVFAKALRSKGHPNYHAVAVVIVVLPFAALYGLVGHIFVKKAESKPDLPTEGKHVSSCRLWLNKRSRTQLILLWLLLGWFAIVATELLLFTYFLLVPDMAKAVLGYKTRQVKHKYLSKSVFVVRTVGVFVWFEDYLINYGRLRVITEVLFEGVPFLLLYAYVLFVGKNESIQRVHPLRRRSRHAHLQHRSRVACPKHFSAQVLGPGVQCRHGQ
jgi:amino acid transporter